VIVDKYNEFCWSIFLKATSDLKTKLMVFTVLKIPGIDGKFICCDDSGKNKAFQNKWKSKSLTIDL
jgi:hypothetical protein